MLLPMAFALTIGSAQAKDLSGRVGVGFNHNFGDRSTISIRYALPLGDPAVQVQVEGFGGLALNNANAGWFIAGGRALGAVMWRWGGKRNQFTFINDSRGFSHQHDIRVQPNGHYTLFDNGNGLQPEYSRALEYVLDEEHLTATLVWEYRNTPDTFSDSMGNAQRRPNGNTVIGWASAERSPVEDWRMRRRKKRVASATRGSTESAINASCQFCRSITATITISVMPSTRITTMLLESRALMVSIAA